MKFNQKVQIALFENFYGGNTFGAPKPTSPTNDSQSLGSRVKAKMGAIKQKSGGGLVLAALTAVGALSALGALKVYDIDKWLSGESGPPLPKEVKQTIKTLKRITSSADDKAKKVIGDVIKILKDTKSINPKTDSAWESISKFAAGIAAGVGAKYYFDNKQKNSRAQTMPGQFQKKQLNPQAQPNRGQFQNKQSKFKR